MSNVTAQAVNATLDDLESADLAEEDGVSEDEKLEEDESIEVDEDDAVEAVMDERPGDVVHHVQQRRRTQRDGAAPLPDSVHVLRRVARPQRGRVQDTDGLGNAFGDLDGGDGVRIERQVRAVLLGGRHGHEDRVLRRQVLADVDVREVGEVP